jgi:hypothetical protein
MLASSAPSSHPERGDMTRDNPAVPHTSNDQELESGAPTALTEITRVDLEHPQVFPLAERRARRELASLAEQCPDHLLGMECYPGRARRYVARARPGTAATPWLVITTDITELRAALTLPPPG